MGHDIGVRSDICSVFVITNCLHIGDQADFCVEFVIESGCNKV